jgi:uncharacterized membrane protein YeaQ/YmgE (transglycosylase-associated protein family)
MSGILIDLIMPIVAGAIGGHAAGATVKNCSLGAIGNTIAGAIGGIGSVRLLEELIPAMANTAGNVDIGALVGQIIGAAAGGAILTILAGVTIWMVTPPKST